MARWNPVPPDPSLERATSWIAGVADQTPDGASLDLVLCDMETDQVVGELGLQIARRHNAAEIGFWVAEAWRGRGAGRALLERSPAVLAAAHVARGIAVVHPRNLAAVGLVRSLGWEPAPRQPADRLAYVIWAGDSSA